MDFPANGILLLRSGAPGRERPAQRIGRRGPCRPDTGPRRTSHAGERQFRSGAVYGSICIDREHAAADGAATAGEDYTAASGTLTFAPGETVKTVSVAVLDDAVSDSGETFTLQLSNVSGHEVELADAEATGTNSNDEAEALTARFENFPTSHNGSTAFTFEFHFGAEIDGLSYAADWTAEQLREPA